MHQNRMQIHCLLAGKRNQDRMQIHCLLAEKSKPERPTQVERMLFAWLIQVQPSVQGPNMARKRLDGRPIVGCLLIVGERYLVERYLPPNIDTPLRGSPTDLIPRFASQGSS